ncbi:hypothetical protein VPH35_117517 [Triticum aestivum]
MSAELSRASASPPLGLYKDPPRCSAAPKPLPVPHLPPESPNLAGVGRRPPWPPRPRLDSGQIEPPLLLLPRPPGPPRSTQPPHPLALSPESPVSPEHHLGCRPWPPLAPPLPSTSLLPGGRVSPKRRRLGPSHPPVASARPEMA